MSIENPLAQPNPPKSEEKGKRLPSIPYLPQPIDKILDRLRAETPSSTEAPQKMPEMQVGETIAMKTGSGSTYRFKKTAENAYLILEAGRNQQWVGMIATSLCGLRDLGKESFAPTINPYTGGSLAFRLGENGEEVTTSPIVSFDLEEGNANAS